MKILSGVKINVTDKPQDGRILSIPKMTALISGLHSATITASVVMRLLRSSSVGLGFDELGIRTIVPTAETGGGEAERHDHNDRTDRIREDYNALCGIEKIE